MYNPHKLTIYALHLCPIRWLLLSTESVPYGHDMTRVCIEHQSFILF